MAEREAMVKGYARKAAFTRSQVNQVKASIVGGPHIRVRTRQSSGKSSISSMRLR